MPWMGRIQRSGAGCVSVPHPSGVSTVARTIETYGWLGGRPFSGYGRPQPKTIAPSCWRATLVAWLGCPGQYCPMRSAGSSSKPGLTSGGNADPREVI